MSESTVLWVDDDPYILRSLRRLLRNEPYHLRIAHGGAEALEQLENSPAQVIVSDQRMPDMTGTEFLERVAERFPHTVRVVLSGYADAGAIVDAVNRGSIYKFLTKPWNDDQLRQTIRECVERHHEMERQQMLVAQASHVDGDASDVAELLGHLLAERSRALEFWQAALMLLPVPLLGVDVDGRIVMANEAVRTRFPDLAHNLLGSDMHVALPVGISRLIDEVNRGEGSSRSHVTRLAEVPVRATVVGLTGAQFDRGCLVMFEPWSYESASSHVNAQICAML
ncbi:MAG: response regulator [Planctomycetaceae bacterium]|nr:response regulator [Planctomycetaceae bacterium]